MTIKTAKDGKFEFVYFLNVPLVYANVQEPKKKLKEPLPEAKNQSEREYTVTVFVDADDRAKLEDEVLINKQLFEVGKDKNKKRKIKYPLKDDKGNDTPYAAYKGLHGVQLTLNELNNSGKPNTLNVVDAEGNPFEELVGNGSVGHVKVYGYRNQEGLLNVAMTTVVILEHVPYAGGSGEIVDDILGITIQTKSAKKAKSVKDEFATDDEPPFEADDNDDDF